MKTQIVGALLGSVPGTSPVASHRGHRPSRPRRRRHRTRRSVKNRYGSWVTLPRPRPRPAQLAPAPSATISMEDREKTRERVVSVASQAVGPTAQEDHLQAQVEALQGQVRNLRQAIHMMQKHQISHQQEQQAGYDWQKKASDIAAAGRAAHTGAGTGYPDASTSRRKFSRRSSFPRCPRTDGGRGSVGVPRGSGFEAGTTGQSQGCLPWGRWE